VKDLVTEYANSVVSSGEIGFVRQMAWSVRKLLQASPGVREVQISVCSEVESTRVELADGTVQLIYYDSMTTIAALLSSLGLRLQARRSVSVVQNGKRQRGNAKQRGKSGIRLEDV